MEILEEAQDQGRKPCKMWYNQMGACQWGNTRKGYWRIADSVILKQSIPNTSLKSAGCPSLMELYFEWNRKIGTAVCRTARTVV